MKAKTKKVLKITISSIICFMCVLGVFLYSKGWIHMPYKAKQEATEIINSQHNDYVIIEHDSGSLVFMPNNPTTGIVLYPGGLVDYRAYAPLADGLARNNILCIILDIESMIPPLEVNAADIIKEYPNINWYVAGHSMGGMAATSYYSKNYHNLDGLILLASYANIDISYTNKRVLCIYGTNDGVLNKDMYDDCLINLPSNYKEVVIEGGCHSYFADYGVDAEEIPQISLKTQINITVDSMVCFITSNQSSIK